MRWQYMNVVDQTAPMLIDATKGTQESDRLRWRLFRDNRYLFSPRIGEAAVPERRTVGFDWTI